MEWLNTILEQAEVVDGKLNVEAVMNAVRKEFPKYAVPKETYNNKATELNTANQTIEELKKSNKDNAELQEKINGYEQQIKDLNTAAETTRKEYALKDSLRNLGAVDTDYIIYKQGGVDKFTFDNNGVPVGVEDSIKTIKESSPHLFKVGSNGGYNPNGGGKGGGATNPFAKETFNLTEQGKLMRSDPARAAELRAAAGIN